MITAIGENISVVGSAPNHARTAFKPRVTTQSGPRMIIQA